MAGDCKNVDKGKGKEIATESSENTTDYYNDETESDRSYPGANKNGDSPGTTKDSDSPGTTKKDGSSSANSDSDLNLKGSDEDQSNKGTKRVRSSYNDGRSSGPSGYDATFEYMIHTTDSESKLVLNSDSSVNQPGENENVSNKKRKLDTAAGSPVNTEDSVNLDKYHVGTNDDGATSGSKKKMMTKDGRDMGTGKDDAPRIGNESIGSWNEADEDMDHVDPHDNVGNSSDDASDNASRMNEERERGKKQKLDTDAEDHVDPDMNPVDLDVDPDMDHVDPHDNVGTSSDDASNEEREKNYDADIEKGNSPGGSGSNETSED